MMQSIAVLSGGTGRRSGNFASPGLSVGRVVSFLLPRVFASKLSVFVGMLLVGFSGVLPLSADPFSPSLTSIKLSVCKTTTCKVKPVPVALQSLNFV